MNKGDTLLREAYSRLKECSCEMSHVQSGDLDDIIRRIHKYLERKMGDIVERLKLLRGHGTAEPDELLALEEIERLHERLNQLQGVGRGLQECDDENRRLREALVEISGYGLGSHAPDLVKIAREVLKGEHDG